MSLQVWLPLTKDTRQQGLSNINVTGSPASWGNGKLGKCATWNGAVANIIYNNTTDFNYTNNFSVAFWANPVYTGSTAQYAWTVGRADAGGYGYGFQIISATTAQFRFGNGSYGVSAPSNEWHHFVMTIGNSKVTIYKDGIQVGSNNLPGTIPTYSDGNGMGLGCFHYSGNIYPYYGSLNDFRIYDHCLSPMEIKELAKGLVLHYPLNRQGWGQENLVTGSNTNSTSTNSWAIGSQAGGNTKTIEQDETGTYCVKFVRDSTTQSGWYYLSYSNLLRNQIKTDTTYTLTFDCKASVNGSINFTGLLNGNATNYMTNSTTNIQPNVVANQWCHMKYQCKTISSFDNITVSGQIVYLSPQSTLKATGVTVYFKNIKLEEGSIATPWCPNSSDTLATTMGLNSTTEYDCSGFCNNGTKVGTLTYSSDTVKYAVSTHFNGSSAIKDTIFPFSSAQWSVAFWYKFTTAPSAYQGFVCLSRNAGGDADKKFAAMPKSDYIWFKFDSTNTTLSSVKVNQWTHIVMTSDGSTGKIYENGVHVGTTGSVGTILTDCDDFVVGARASSTDAASTGVYLNGNMSDVRVYATALSADDVKSLYQNSAYIDSSGNVYGAVHTEV